MITVTETSPRRTVVNGASKLVIRSLRGGHDVYRAADPIGTFYTFRRALAFAKRQAAKA